MTQVFSLTNGADTAGIGGRLAKAFKRHGGRDWALRSMVATYDTTYIKYPQDVPWSQPQLERLYDSADVVHIHSTLFAHDAYDAGQGKPTVLMHHGLKTGQPDRPDFFEMVQMARAIGAVQVGSTLDLSIYQPEVAWLPAPYDLGQLRAIRAASPPRDPDIIRIVHAPTNRRIKGTEAFIDLVSELRVKGHRVEYSTAENRTWADALTLYATADIAYDQPTLGYGCFAIECWAMGIPVVAGVADPKVCNGMVAEWGALPFSEDLAALVGSVEARKEYADMGTQHVERYHADAKVVERAKDIYASAKPTTPGMATRRKRFRGLRLVAA